MHVTVEDVPQVPVGNKGILLRIRDEKGRNVGKLWIGQAKVRWAAGNVPDRNAKSLPMKKLVDYLNSL